jgi:hypothetical protein
VNAWCCKSGVVAAYMDQLRPTYAIQMLPTYEIDPNRTATSTKIAHQPTQQQPNNEPTNHTTHPQNAQPHKSNQQTQCLVISQKQIYSQQSPTDSRELRVGRLLTTASGHSAVAAATSVTRHRSHGHRCTRLTNHIKTTAHI